MYGSRIPYTAFFGEAARLVKGRTAPSWGSGMYRYFEHAEKLAADADICRQALVLATSLGVPELLEETRVIGGYIAMLQALSELQTALAAGQPEAAAREPLTAAMARLTAAGLATSRSLRAWEQACGGGGGGRFEDTVQVTEQTVVDVGAYLATLGLPNTAKGLFKAKVGAWATADFEATEQLQKVFDVTELLGGPGAYEVRFQYERGWHGLRMFKVSLASAPADQPGARTELSVDAHEGTAAYRNVANTYTVTLPTAVEAGRRYYLVAEIRGTRSSDKPDNRRGCEGSVWLRKVDGA